jgi:26S proteasome regulatory subunit N7
MDSLATFTAVELMEYDDFVALTVLAGALGCDRKTIKERVSFPALYAYATADA